MRGPGIWGLLVVLGLRVQALFLALGPRLRSHHTRWIKVVATERAPSVARSPGIRQRPGDQGGYLEENLEGSPGLVPPGWEEGSGKRIHQTG